MTPNRREEIPPGTLDMLILKTLARSGPMHGFQIADYIQKTTEDILQVEEGSLYPALQRMLIKGWIAGEWGKTAENRRARYYQLTPEGRQQLESELARYGRVAGAIARVLEPA
ncbi:MAG: PadR family transcriptional regulator [Bryobacteraceae bacterium]